MKVLTATFVLFLSMFLFIGCPAESSNLKDYDTAETEDVDNTDDYEEYFNIEDYMYSEQEEIEE